MKQTQTILMMACLVFLYTRLCISFFFCLAFLLTPFWFSFGSFFFLWKGAWRVVVVFCVSVGCVLSPLHLSPLFAHGSRSLVISALTILTL